MGTVGIIANPHAGKDIRRLVARAASISDADKISILRRSGDSQQAITFDYTDVEYGRNLEQNIVLQADDIVVVP